jgi:membrane protease subunit HflK
MPWSSQNGGRKGGGGGPWGQGPSGGPHQPDLEELLKRSQDRLKQVMPGGSGVPGSLLFLVAGDGGHRLLSCLHLPASIPMISAWWCARQADTGRSRRACTSACPIRSKVRLPKVTRQNIIEVGFRSGMTSRGFPGGVSDRPEESLMLTGDENIVDVDFVVFWRIRDAQQYLSISRTPTSP